MWRTLLTCASFQILGLVCVDPCLTVAEEIKYNRDVRPILAENCFPCHGPDSAARKADLRLDRRDPAVESKAIVPGDPEASELVERVFAGDPSERMPPATTKKELTAAQKDLLRRWIAAGAAYEAHWSLIPPTRPEPPQVKNSAWVRNPIDRFILAKLEERGLAPAPEADRRTLARRLSLDLTGLPPEPQLVEAFVNDKSPEAYVEFVDRLLASQRWGEHRGRYWLDAARYADTHGIHFDNYRENWAYRDWAISAFNRNMPFDQFTIEQLAGDLLPNHTLEQQVASGFNRCNITTNEGGVIPEEYLVLYTRDRTETVAKVWLGTTANCAVCHDHKFDPLTQREFYEMAAFFNNTTQGAMDGNIKDTPPVVLVPRAEDRPRWEAIQQELPAQKQLVDSRRQGARPDFEAWVGSVQPAQLSEELPRESLRFHALLGDGQAPIAVTVDGRPRQLEFASPPTWQAGHVAAQAFQVQEQTVIQLDDVGDFDRTQAFSYGAWIRLGQGNKSGAVLARMKVEDAYRGWDLWVENNRVGAHIINRWPDDAIKILADPPVKPTDWTHVFVTYDGSGKAAGVKVYVNGSPQPTTIVTDKLQGTIRTEVPLKIGQRSSAQRLDGLLVQDVRIYAAALTREQVANIPGYTRAKWLASNPNRSAAETDELFGWWLANFDNTYRELNARLAELELEQSTIKGRGTIAHVMQEKPESPTAFVLYRGEYDKRRDPVQPDTPDAMPPMPAELPRNRLGFAQWLLRPEQPLTARVTVNRFWQEVFGTGLVRTSGDFGVSGELPSHPDLLDWLAIEFRDSGWDMKRFFRLMVTSATYRQAAAVTAEKIELDPDNRLLSRGPRFRMDAEMVRDYALAASGLLSDKIGGPSVRPYQPDGVWEAVAMIGSNTRDYKRDSGESLYRRSMYTFWKRSAPPASMEIFNAPSRELCTVRRERTNTPLQALVTLNDPQFVEAARQLAQLAMRNGGDSTAGRIDFLARKLLCRPLRPDELAIVDKGFAAIFDYYRSSTEEAKQLVAVGESPVDATLDVPTLAAWTMLTNELMNLDEVLCK